MDMFVACIERVTVKKTESVPRPRPVACRTEVCRSELGSTRHTEDKVKACRVRASAVGTAYSKLLEDSRLSPRHYTHKRQVTPCVAWAAIDRHERPAPGMMCRREWPWLCIRRVPQPRASSFALLAHASCNEQRRHAVSTAFAAPKWLVAHLGRATACELPHSSPA